MISTNNWFISALISMICYACMALVLKRLSMSLGTPLILLYLFATTSLLFLFYSVHAGINYKIEFSLAALVLLASVFAFAGNYFDLQALSLAPNAGYAAAVKAGQIIVITVGALYLFKGQSISLSGATGILLIFTGIGLLSIQGE